MKITLPKPPSTNHIYKFTSQGGFARSYISKEGNLWFSNAGLILKSHYKTCYDGPVSFYIKLYCIRNDIDGIIKPTLDLFQKTGIIKNDRQVMFLQIEKIIIHKAYDEKLEIELIADK